MAKIKPKTVSFIHDRKQNFFYYASRKISPVCKFQLFLKTSVFSTLGAKKTIMFDMVLNTPLSYRERIWYYNTGDTRVFLAQRSKPTTKLTLKITNKSFSAWLFSSMLLTALGERLERKIFRLLEVIPIVIGRGLEKS